ncbi:GNAT family N-acetyltransferase [Phaeobacter sp. J2-8]|uniref:GNAT family N-acetyltransferase n=1 Tax=Phaeobacter sp. J2-8 TaxID=2931394 RepID=UPI001FD2A08A|nr:GNAT family N-acetyltransferase [Phaeobacter sp. J2-8]MCJ7874929.1 GNAT family N-acetyltransferase [Phaeobacter sp. J2-8]
MNLKIRPARSTDAGKIGEIMTEGNAAPDWKPHLHSAAQDIAFCGRMIDRGWVRVAENNDGRIVGFIARDGEEINTLYVRATAQGRGVGKQLLREAMRDATRLELWTFQLNTGARRFYEREGFVAVKETDGADNQEQLPDVRFAWERPK